MPKNIDIIGCDMNFNKTLLCNVSEKMIAHQLFINEKLMDHGVEIVVIELARVNYL